MTRFHPRSVSEALFNTMSPLKAVFFDAGNTLIHLDYGFIAEVLSQEGLLAEPDAIRAAEYRARVKLDPLLGNGPTETTRVFQAYARFILDGLGVPWDARAWRALEELEASNRTRGLWTIPSPHAQAVLQELMDEGYTLGVISNSNGTIEALLRATDLARFFSVIFDSAVVGFEKPDPRIFQRAVETAGVRPDEAVHIGDLYSVDILGSRAAGLHGILLDPVGAWRHVRCLKAQDLLQARVILQQQFSRGSGDLS